MQTDVEPEIAVLARLTVNQLRERYVQLFGEVSRSRHREHLVRKIAWRIQALHEGDLSERARRRAEELARDSDARVTPPRENRQPELRPSSLRRIVPVASGLDPRLPAPGTVIVRDYKRLRLEVMVLEDGFEYAGQHFKSLSAVAKVVTGSHCNGFRFFGLEMSQ